MERFMSFSYIVFLTSLMTRWATSFMKYDWQNSKKFLNNQNISTRMVILLRSSMGGMAFTISMRRISCAGTNISPGMAIFLPVMILSISGIIMLMDTPLKADVPIMQRDASTSTQIWGKTNLINLVYSLICSWI